MPSFKWSTAAFVFANFQAIHKILWIQDTYHAVILFDFSCTSVKLKNKATDLNKFTVTLMRSS